MTESSTSSEGAEFTSVDLDIESEEDLSPVLAALAQRTFVVSRDSSGGAERVTLELISKESTRPPEIEILDFVELIEALSSTENEVWNAARSRTLSVGIKLRGDVPIELKLSCTTLARAARNQMNLAFTVYGRTA